MLFTKKRKKHVEKRVLTVSKYLFDALCPRRTGMGGEADGVQVARRKAPLEFKTEQEVCKLACALNVRPRRFQFMNVDLSVSMNLTYDSNHAR